MKILKLGYTQKWLDYKFLDKETLSKQIAEFKKGDDPNTEQYRFTSFQNWLEGKEKLTDQEVNHYIELAIDDTDNIMSGSAVKNLFASSKISDQQFELLKATLPQFGKWTQKVISREVLKRRLNKEELTTELFYLCYTYKKEFKDNRLLLIILQNTDNVEFLSLFSELEIGKRIKKLAQKKLKQVEKAGHKT